MCVKVAGVGGWGGGHKLFFSSSWGWWWKKILLRLGGGRKNFVDLNKNVPDPVPLTTTA